MPISNFQFLRQNRARFRRKISKKGGFTLVEAIVGVALLLIVFMGIFAAYRLGLKVVGLSKNKITATAIANSRIESIRNLAYDLVGLDDAVLPEALGSLKRTAAQTVSGDVYTINTRVVYAIDPADGVGAADNCDLDYKKVDVAVSWGGGFSGSVSFSTDISPENLVQEIQSCMSQPGGVLEVTVFDASGIPIPMPTIKIYNLFNNTIAGSASPTSGKYAFPLVVGNYRVEVDKDGYVPARTYGSNEVAVPDSPNPTVLNGALTPISFSIDRAASISIDGISPAGQSSFADSFEDQLKIAEINNALIDAGSVILAGPPHPAEGSIVSNAIAPDDLVAWDSLEFDDSHPPSTDATYQLLYFNGVDWIAIPDSDLSGNGAGFSNSPVSLAGLVIADYPEIKIAGTIASSDENLTPRINSWQVFWTTGAGLPVPNINFHVQGAKTIGFDAEGDAVYKYSRDHVLDGIGHFDIAGVDGDRYTFAVDPAEGLSLIAGDPWPQPVNVPAGSSTPVKLFLRAQNALLATVKNDLTLAPVPSAAVRIFQSSTGYDKTRYTDINGQTYFAPLENGDYVLEISAPGYDNYSATAAVSGETRLVKNIKQQE